MISTILHPRYILLPILISLAACGGTALAAGLVFPAKAKDIEIEITETTKTIPYEFKNESSSPIKIVGMKASCGCTVATLEKKEYASGESGEISIEYKRVANTEKGSNSVLVVTDEEKDNFYTLILRVTQKEGIKLSKRTLDWIVGGSDEPQMVDVTVSEETPFNITGVRTTHDSFEGKLSTVEPQKKYTVTVQPTTCEYPAIGAMRILTDNPSVPPVHILLRVVAKKNSDEE